jgi:hypothetical protein
MDWQIQARIDLMRHGMHCRAITSVATDEYNCIAWAMDDQSNFWWPNGSGFWPGRLKGQAFAPTLAVFHAAFATRGYSPCVDSTLEPGFEKVALYAKGLEITHAARQLASGFWTSKLGRHVDVEHELGQIEGPAYGTVIAYLSRPRPP